MKLNKILALSAIFACGLTLAACNQTPTEQPTDQPTTEQPTTVEPTTEQPTTEEPVYVYDENFDFEGLGYNVPQVEQKEELKPYDPTTFDVSSYQIIESKQLGEGVELVVANFNLNSGANVTPYCVVVDLNKANVVAGSYNNTTSVTDFTTLSVPIKQAIAWKQANPGKKFYAVTNADFFGSTTVNAFVKDGKF